MASYIAGTDRYQPMLLPAAVDDYVPQDDPVRAIDAFVDSLELHALGFRTRSEHSEGRSSYHPGTLLKLYLWGYLKKAQSSRKLESACTENLQAIWLTGNLRPDHSTISLFRKDHAPALKNILRQFNGVCFELKLFSKELIGIDGTFIKAVNSPAKSYTKGKLKKLLEIADRAIEDYLGQLETNDQAPSPASDEKDDPAELQRKLDKIRARKSDLQDLQTRCEENETGQANLTDPDCVQLRKRGQTTVGYNVQSAVDNEHHLIATIEVTQNSTDQHLLDPIAQQAKSDLGLPADAPLEVLADSGYGTGPQLAACESHSTIAVASLPKNKSESNGLHNQSDFTPDPESDTYTCPQGETLTRKADRTERGGHRFHTYTNPAACRACPQRAACTKGQTRTLAISAHHQAIARAKTRLAERPGAMRHRAALVEHPFGTIKHRNGYGGGLLCRGLALAGAEMSLSGWAYNFTRVIGLVDFENFMAALRTPRAPHPGTELTPPASRKRKAKHPKEPKPQEKNAPKAQKETVQRGEALLSGLKRLSRALQNLLRRDIRKSAPSAGIQNWKKAPRGSAFGTITSPFRAVPEPA
jgi:transposase